MIKKLIIFLFIFILTIPAYSKAIANNGICPVVSGKYYSIIMPCDTENTFVAKKRNNSIEIFEKISAKSNQGGLAFALEIFKNPKDYAELPNHKKIGELRDKNGVLYDMVLKRPNENMCADGKEAEENFIRLYDSAQNIEIKGINGSTYYKNQGTKGADLYKDVLKKYKQALKENWNWVKISQENLGSISKILIDKKKPSLKKLGYAYYDINSDGIDELFIGEVKKSGATVYDIYTMVDRKPEHVLARNYSYHKYFICNDTYICRDAQVAKDKNIFTVIDIEKNSTERKLVVEYLYNEKLSKTNPWFRTFKAGDKYQSVSKETYDWGINSFSDFLNLDYIPLSKLDDK